jgi:hypothetical protein
MRCKNKGAKLKKFNGKHACKLGGYCIGDYKCSYFIKKYVEKANPFADKRMQMRGF